MKIGKAGAGSELAREERVTVTLGSPEMNPPGIVRKCRMNTTAGEEA